MSEDSLPWEIDTQFNDIDIGPSINTINNNQDLPTEGIWRFAPLYKVNIDGKLMLAWIGYDTHEKQILTAVGLNNGKVNISKRQGEITEIRKEYEKTWKDYYRHPGKVAEFEKPMTPNKWEVGKTKLKYPVIVQPMLNKKNRCLCRDDGKDIVFSCKGKKNTSEISKLFLYIPYNVVLDGYLEDIYIICDFNTSERLPYEKRWNILDTAIKQYLKDGNKMSSFKLIDNYTAMNQEQVLGYCSHLSDILIKRVSCVENCTDRDIDSALYKSGKSNNNLKYKNYTLLKDRVKEVNLDSITLESGKVVNPKDILDNNKYIIGSLIKYKVKN